ncbi:glycosyltransferase [Dyadobacter bucti]|uniref:glycosyltransferase n=1 Tax=Dyadobacter bucti TaxID=2572203 RepID=UPI003F6EC28B
MKILHVITLAELGGAQSVLLNLVKESVRAGDEVMVASSSNGELWNILPREVQKAKIPSLKRKISLYHDLKVIYELRHVNRAYKPDVIHLHSSKIGILGRIAFPARKIIYTIHGFDSIRLAFRKFLYLERLLQFRSRYIVGVSNYDLKNMVEEGIRHHVSCIYNGISDSYGKFPEPQTDSFTRIKTKILAEQSFRVLCIARLSPPKNFRLFCQVAEEMKSYPVHFFWIGNKQEVPDTPANVHCLGQVEDAHLLLKYADLFMLPTNFEGMPISIIEALCYSVPVTASNVGGISEMLNGQNGMALENTVEAFVFAIRHYMNDPNALESAKANARATYEQHFTVKSMFSAYQELYHSIAPENLNGTTVKLPEPEDTI